MLSKVRIALLGVSACVATLATVSPASASDVSGVGGGVPGAYGWLENIRWTSDVSLVYFDFYVKDTAADGDHAQARVQVLVGDNRVESFSWHYAYGYGTVNSFPTYVNDDEAVKAIRIEACRKGDDLPDICDYSPWAYQF
jgi:hypothetical protein